MSGEVIVGVVGLIFTFSFALSQYWINLRLVKLNERLVKLTGSMDTYHSLMVRLEAKKQGVRTIWWNPEEYRKQAGRKWPRNEHGQSAEPTVIRMGVKWEDRGEEQ